MSTPITERLRALADEAWSRADELVDIDPIALRELAYRQANALRAAADLIERAPHAGGCHNRAGTGHSGYPNYLPVKCTCWKADALG